jgi:hypothetical protein
MKYFVHSRWIKYVICAVSIKKTYCSSIIQFFQCDISMNEMLQLFLIFFGTGSEVLTVVKISNMIWVRTLYSVMHGYESFGGAF